MFYKPGDEVAFCLISISYKPAFICARFKVFCRFCSGKSNLSLNLHTHIRTKIIALKTAENLFTSYTVEDAVVEVVCF